MTDTAPSGPSGPVEILKKVKAAEEEAESAVARARKESEDAVGRARAESDAAIASAFAEGERAREAAIDRARTDAERGAAEVEAKATDEVEAMAKGSDRLTAARREALLDAVLGAFRSE